jgi:tetratricopeptide (TPR) repeat protein
MRTVLILAAGALLIVACQSFEGPLPPASPKPGPSTPSRPQEPPVQEPPEQPSRPQKQYKLGAAARALVSQADEQAKSGDTIAATATLERALRIEPDNPLLWIELGQLRLQERNPAQAQSLGRKALALATGDPRTQSSAWQLIAQALKAQGRNQEAAEAQARAEELASPLSNEREEPDSFIPEYEDEEGAESGDVIEV